MPFETQASTAALFALSAVLFGLAINQLPVELVVAAQHRLLASGTFDASFSSSTSAAASATATATADAAIVLGYSVEEGVPTLPLVARVELGVKLFCTGAVRNLIFSGCVRVRRYDAGCLL